MYVLVWRIVFLELSSESNFLIINIMNIQKHRASIWNSFLSVLVLGVFIVVGLGCYQGLPSPIVEIKYLGEGVYEQTTWKEADENYITQTGKKDKYNRWHGPCKIVSDYDAQKAQRSFSCSRC